MRRLFVIYCCLSCLVFVVGAQSALDWVSSEVKGGPGVAALQRLSDFSPVLRETPFDTPVFIMGDLCAPRSAAIISGAHANEIAGILASYWIIERCHVREWRLIVVPHANASGATWSLRDASGPRLLYLGKRAIRYGARLSNPSQECFSDPASFVPPQASPSFAPLAGQEARNLNRQYPGARDGNYTAQTAYALTQMLIAENTAIALDLHEASPGSSLGWSIIARPENLDLAALAVLDIEEAAGVSFHLEDSREEFAGYSHWEWGKLGIRAFLVETLNPAQPTDDPSIDQLSNPVAPLARRVYAHLCAAKSLLTHTADSLKNSDALHLDGFPSSLEEVSRWLEQAR